MTDIILQQHIGEITPVSWDGDGEMTFAQWEAIGQTFQQVAGSLNWWLGDWLNYGEARYGETYAQAIEVTGWAIQRLKDAKWVAHAVPKEMRHSALSWTHHRHVAHLEPLAQEQWLALADEMGYSSAELFHEIREAGLGRKESHQLLHSSQSVEYYTPPDILQDARQFLGGIDLDPASCASANEMVGARYYYTAEEDGLSRAWDIGGKPVRVWLNPPYGFREGESNQALWSARLHAAYLAGIVSEALMLVNAATGASWFGPLWEYPICFVGYRIRFLDEQGQATTSPTQYNAIVYFGERVAEFVEIFGKYGACVQALA